MASEKLFDSGAEFALKVLNVDGCGIGTGSGGEYINGSTLDFSTLVFLEKFEEVLISIKEDVDGVLFVAERIIRPRCESRKVQNQDGPGFIFLYYRLLCSLCLAEKNVQATQRPQFQSEGLKSRL